MTVTPGEGRRGHLDIRDDFKNALQAAVRDAGFTHQVDLEHRTGLSHSTVSAAFSSTQAVPSAKTVHVIVTAIHGSTADWEQRRRAAASAAGSAVTDGLPESLASSVTASPSAAAQDPATVEDDSRPLSVDAPHASARSKTMDQTAAEASGAGAAVGTGPDGEAAKSKATSGPEQRKRSWRRRGWVVVTSALLVAGGAAVTAWWDSTADTSTSERTIVVQNKVAFGGSTLEEDRSPSYLATRPVARCADIAGCKLPGTDLASGDTVEAVCQLQGALLTNADVASAGVKDNPNVAASTLWYGVRWRDGRRGFISEVYIAPQYRGGLQLPPC